MGPATPGEWRDPDRVRCSTNFGNGYILGNGVTLTPNLPAYILGQATSRVRVATNLGQFFLQTVQKQRVFLTPSGLFCQYSGRLGHGKNFFRALEGVPTYTKKVKYTKSVPWGGGTHMPCTRGTPLPYVQIQWLPNFSLIDI